MDVVQAAHQILVDSGMWPVAQVGPGRLGLDRSSCSFPVHRQHALTTPIPADVG